jgi:hypothetical protein
MRFKIQYFKQDTLVGERPWLGTFQDCRKVARDGLVVHSADTVKVLDESGNEALIVRLRARVPSKDKIVRELMPDTRVLS